MVETHEPSEGSAPWHRTTDHNRQCGILGQPDPLLGEYIKVMPNTPRGRIILATLVMATARHKILRNKNLCNRDVFAGSLGHVRGQCTSKFQSQTMHPMSINGDTNLQWLGVGYGDGRHYRRSVVGLAKAM